MKNLNEIRQSRSAQPWFGRVAAFTLIELLVVIAIIAILAGLLLPALAAAKMKAKITGDRNNKNQAQKAIFMYTGDFSESVPPNAPISTGVNAWIPGVSEDWHTDPHNIDPSYYDNALLAPYVGNQLGVYRSPCDDIPSDNGIRIRSISMNGQVGCAQGLTDNPGWQVYYKISDMVCPQPSQLWCFCNETMWSINDGYLQMNLNTSDYPDVPAAYDGGGNVFSFFDGHVEYQKWAWQDPNHTAGLLACPYSYGVQRAAATHWGSSAQDVDYKWLRAHSACKTGTNNF